MEQIKYLDWDSDFFGYDIGRIELNCLSISSIEKAISEAEEKNIDCLYLEIPFKSPDILNYCYDNDFRLVDFRTILNKTLPCTAKSTSSMTRSLKESYYPLLKSIVCEVARQGRYVYDPKFGLSSSTMLYEKWLEKSFYNGYSDDFIIYLKDDNPVGFLTIRNKGSVPYIDLLGVLKKNRGEKIGTALILEAENKLIKYGYKNIKVVTQGHNAQTLRFYQNACFRTETINAFYHKWLRK